MFLEFIVPYFGNADLLIQGVSTILRQTDKTDIGVIIVDDNDGTGEGASESIKVQGFLDSMKGITSIPITYVKNEQNVGPGSSRNNGLARASAKYVSFVDSDDYLNENFVQVFREECAKGEDFDIFVGSCLAVKSNTEYLHISPEIITWVHGKMYNRDFLINNKIQFPPLRLNEDSGFNSIAYDTTHAIRYYQGTIPMYYWMQTNPSSLTKKSEERPYEESICAYVESVTFAYTHLLDRINFDKLDRFPAQIYQIYLFYAELLYRNESVDAVEKVIQKFFNLIHPTKWYQSGWAKDRIAYFAIHENILGPVIPEITFSGFVKRFEKEPLNFR